MVPWGRANDSSHTRCGRFPTCGRSCAIWSRTLRTPGVAAARTVPEAGGPGDRGAPAGGARRPAGPEGRRPDGGRDGRPAARTGRRTRIRPFPADATVAGPHPPPGSSVTAAAPAAPRPSPGRRARRQTDGAARTRPVRRRSTRPRTRPAPVRAATCLVAGVVRGTAAGRRAGAPRPWGPGAVHPSAAVPGRRRGTREGRRSGHGPGARRAGPRGTETIDSAVSTYARVVNKVPDCPPE